MHDRHLAMPGSVKRQKASIEMASVYKRAYKACENCRKNKAKCEVDSITSSCTRCVREQRECVIPAVRSTKRARISNDNRVQDTTNLISDSSMSQTNQRHTGLPHVTNTDNVVTTSTHTNNVSEGWRHTAPRRSVGSQLPTHNHSISGTFIDNGRPKSQQQRTASYSQPQRKSSQLDEHTSPIQPGLQNDILQTFVTSSSDAIGLLFRAAEQNDSDSSDERGTQQGLRQNDELNSPYSMSVISSPAVASNETLSLWEQHRFCRQGWFTPREAVSYIEFFYQNLSPLSPVADSFYVDHRHHRKLIVEEPLLCCTLLMIASRYHDPTKAAGGRARADFVHNRVWKHIEHLIQRITFGAEKYSLAKTRTLGSIQALLLITEWHPRALHFPPENDGWDASLAPATDDSFTPSNSNSEASKRWREDVFEPAKRSDRMSWMLVGLATTLAHELGVFDHEEAETSDPEVIEKRRAKLKIRRLLFLYVSQLSLRLGCSSVFPYNTQQSIAYIPQPNTPPEEQAGQDREMLITKWIDITKLLMTATEMLFASKVSIKQMFKSSRYMSLLEHFQPLLTRWHGDFEEMSCPTLAKTARQILLVEYHFVRMYINSIAVQALVERASSYNVGNVWTDQEFLRSEFSQDFRFIKEVRDSSVEILRIATQLSKDGTLQYCPVRVFLRVVAASIYLLKTISLGSREADVTKSLEQLELCIEALQTNRADDIHLSSRYATLIARHVRRFKRNFRTKRSNAYSNTVSRAATLGPDGVSAPNKPIHDISNVQGNQVQPSFGPSAASQTYNMIDNTTRSAMNDIMIPFDFDENGMIEDWLAQPFNMQFAPFGSDDIQPATGLAIDSLDFLWNMAT